MISIEPFWKQMEKKGITTYIMQYQYDLNPCEISRLRNNHNFTLKTINKLCTLFDCDINDIIIYTPDKSVITGKCTKEEEK